jgi:ribosomal protein S18 acetylase RimI-like enzyme
MIREHLENLSSCPPPPGFSMRWYQRGDKEHWTAIHRRAEPDLEIQPDMFDRLFGLNEQLLLRRQAYIVRESDGLVTGTATAWFDRDFAGMEFGRVHWVAVLPECQKQGLGRVLVSAVCQRLKELGYKRAYLVTWSNRPWAIRLYERFGFELGRTERDGAA